MALIVYPPARSFLFPPVPLALVDRKSGGIQNPRAGMLGSHDSMTGAPERHKGEAVELEAHNFVSGFASVGLGAAMGNRQKNKAQDDGGAIDKILPDATNISTRAVDAKGTVADGLVATKHDKTKQPTEVVVWEKARPFMRALADVADVWEVIAKYARSGHHSSVTRYGWGNLHLLTLPYSLVAPYRRPSHSRILLGFAWAV